MNNGVKLIGYLNDSLIGECEISLKTFKAMPDFLQGFINLETSFFSAEVIKGLKQFKDVLDRIQL